MQLIVPGTFVLALWRGGDHHGATVPLWWLGQNCWNISVYVMDAASEEFPVYLITRSGHGTPSGSPHPAGDSGPQGTVFGVAALCCPDPRRGEMARCEVCGNDYYLSFEVVAAGHTHTFDSFECAIHRLAPICEHCGCKIIGHGIEAEGTFYCCAHCARESGVMAAVDHV